MMDFRNQLTVLLHDAIAERPSRGELSDMIVVMAVGLGALVGIAAGGDANLAEDLIGECKKLIVTNGADTREFMAGQVPEGLA